MGLFLTESLILVPLKISFVVMFKAFLTLSLAASGFLGCAYRMGSVDKQLPGGYERVAIPVFQNKTMTVGVERFFTNELIRQFERSKIAKVIDKGESPLVIEGTIKRIEILPNTQVKDFTYLPTSSVLNTEYRILVDTFLRVRRKSDQRILWEGQVSDEKVYPAPLVTTSTVNSVNPLYNQSARNENVAQMAKDMMAEAHDRMTENF